MHCGDLSSKKRRWRGGVAAEYGPVKTPHALAERIGLMDTVNRGSHHQSKRDREIQS